LRRQVNTQKLAASLQGLIEDRILRLRLGDGGPARARRELAILPRE